MPKTELALVGSIPPKRTSVKKKAISQKLSREQCEKVVSGHTPYNLNKIQLVYFRGVARNRPVMIRNMLKAGKISLFHVLHIGFTPSGELELAVNTKSIDKVISYLASFNKVQVALDYHPISATAEAEAEKQLLGLRKRLSALDRKDASLPEKRFSHILRKMAEAKKLDRLQDLLWSSCEQDNNGVDKTTPCGQ